MTIKFFTPSGTFQARCIGGRKLAGIKLVARKSGYSVADLSAFDYEVIA